jgi:putative tricarboxylic transport membrane protein
VAISLSLFVYTIAVNWLGFVLATLMFVFFLFRIVETESWWRSLLKGILVTAGNYLVFVVWLGLHLPKGVLPW